MDMFKDAYFGKRYITKSNKKSIFWNTTPEGDYILIREDVFKVFVYDKEGRDITGDSKNDIVSELKISEEELDEYAESASKSYWSDDMETFDGNPLEKEIYYVCRRCYEAGIKTGYRKAKKE